MFRLIARSAVLLCALFLGSCGGGGGNSAGINLYVADAPIDNAASVIISLTGMSVTGDAGTQNFPFVASVPLDFYQLQAGLAAFLINANLPAGNYTAITLDFDAPPGTFDSNITLIGSAAQILYIPGNMPSNITVPIKFTLGSNTTLNITLDMDLRKSVYQDPNNPAQYILQPSLRAVANAAAGNITGTIALTRVTSGCIPAVYVYSGKVTPTDVDINAPAGSVQPITSALVALNGTTSQYNFTAAFLPAGLYTLAFTCQAGMDDPTKADNISFTSIATATVVAEQTIIVNLP